MSMFDYRDFDFQKLMPDTMALITYMAESMSPDSALECSFDDYNKDGAWRALMPDDFGHSGLAWDSETNSFRGEFPLYEGAQVQILGKYDTDGKLTSIGLTFWGMNGDPGEFLTTASGIIGPAGGSYSFVHSAFDYLLTTVAQFAQDNGLTGHDIIVTGGSMGGMCVNSMASSSALGCWNGFYEDSAYIACMSPTQNDLNDNVLNIGLENDPVFRLAEGDSIDWNNALGHLTVHDKPMATCTNNISVFHDYYSNGGWESILLPDSWANGHSPYLYEKAVRTIFNSDFYQATNIDSTVIIAALSDEKRANTWVQDLNYNAQPHTGPTFIIGSDQDDLIQGGKGIDYLEGKDGNDTFRDSGGYNIIQGGSGIDTYDTQDHFDYKSWTHDALGNTWVRGEDGGVTILNGVEQIKGGYSGWIGIGWYDITGHFTDEGLTFSYQGNTGFKAYSETAHADLYQDSVVTAKAPASGESGFLFGYSGNDTLIGTTRDEVFCANDGDDILFLGGGKDTVMITGENFGHDRIYSFDENDTLVFMSNSKMVTNTSVLDYMDVVGNDIIFNFEDDNSVTLVGGASYNLSHDQFVCG